MKRRTFLIGTAAVVSPLGSTFTFAQGNPPGSRAAVVIGVNSPGNLPRLSAAATGARQVEAWLRGEGFETKLFTDDGGKKVHAFEIADAVTELVQRGTLSQLVIYFSGHGFLLGDSEHWLLSSAPDSADDAINVAGSVDFARDTAIKNIVFISDACRSTADSLSASRVGGIRIFPNTDIESAVHTYVDRFFAAKPGKPAFEVKVSDSLPQFQGIFTASFLSAFENPTDTMVSTAEGVTYVPTRELEDFLDSDVPRRAREKSIRLNQRPESIIESRQSAYIGRAIRIVTGQPAPPDRQISVRDLANHEIRSAGADLFAPSRVMSGSEVRQISEATGFEKSQQLIGKTQQSRSFDTQAGFIVTGATVRSVVTSSKLQAKIAEAGNGTTGSAIVSVTVRPDDVGSIAIAFGNGTATVLAAVYGFVGSVLIEDGKVINVSYVPALNGPRWGNYMEVREQLDRLRATVAAAAQYGEFRIEGRPEARSQAAEQLADKIRVLKGIDPTLGLYAAYAYSDGGLRQKVRSVRDFMRNDLGGDLFDVAMLARARPDPDRVAPFCPMLTQGWNLLDFRKTGASSEVAALRPHLRPALWTTFDSEGFNIVREGLERRNLQ